MRFRVPAFKRNIESSLEGIVESTFKILMHQGKLPKQPKVVEDLIQKQGYDFLKVKIANWKILQYMFEMAFQSENSTLLREMKYQLIFAPNGHHFITGDSPVALYHPDYEFIKPYGVGPAFKEIELTFPISKELLIKLTWHGDEGVKEAQKEEVQEYNRRTLIMAEKYIFSSEANQNLIQQIAQYHNVQAGYKFDSLWFGEGSMHISRFIPVTK
jgi:hypothetical protein